MKTAAASAILLLLGFCAIWAATGGFEALTSEQTRRLEIAREQPAAPDVSLIDQTGRTFRFGRWAQEKNKFIIVDFIYTNCQSLCRALGTEFQQLQRDIAERGLQNRVHLLSVSFDPEHDTHEVLRQYAERIQADPDTWTLATVANVQDLDALLRVFGVTVIPDQQGGFQHNAALVWIAPPGRLVRVADYGSGNNLGLLDELARQD